MAETSGFKKQLRAAFLGPEATYTHQAALSSFPPTPQHTPILTPLPTIPSVFSSVQDSTSTNGVIPFENSTNGSVVASLDLFVDAARLHQDVLVVGEQYVKVEHCLLGHRPPPSISPSIPRTSEDVNGDNPFAHVTDVYTHPQAWTQCSAFLAAHLRHARRHDVSSTSAAAALVAGDLTGTSVAISSGMAAEAHGVPILRKGVEDRGDNVTRFFVLGRRDDVAGIQGEVVRKGKVKSLVTFTLHADDDPGSLAKALAVFERWGINLTSINARPSGAGPWRYCFLVEVLSGAEAGEETSDRGSKLTLALRDLATVVKSWRWCGSWESGLG